MTILEGDLRRSAVEAYGCPYRYQQIYLNGVDDTGDESLRGRAFHAAAWVYILRLAAKGARDAAAAEQAGLPRPSHVMLADHEEAQLALRQGIAVTGCPDHLVAHVTKLWDRWVLRFELDLEAFFQAEELVRRGRRTFRPDLVYVRPGELEIVDFKTYYKGLTEAQAKEELQPRWYLVEAVQIWPGFERYRFTFDFVRLGYQVSLVFTPEDIAAFEPGVQGAIDAVVQAEERGEFPPMPGSHCTLCRLACPVVDAPERIPIRVTGVDQALDVFGQILALEQRVKVLKKALGGFVKIEGAINLRGERYSYEARDSVRYPLDEVLDALPPGFNHEVITVSPTSLKPAWRTKDLMPDELQAAAIVKRGWTFRHKKHGAYVPDGLDDVLAEEGPDDDDGTED